MKRQGFQLDPARRLVERHRCLRVLGHVENSPLAGRPSVGRCVCQKGQSKTLPASGWRHEQPCDNSQLLSRQAGRSLRYFQRGIYLSQMQSDVTDEDTVNLSNPRRRLIQRRKERWQVVGKVTGIAVCLVHLHEQAEARCGVRLDLLPYQHGRTVIAVRYNGDSVWRVLHEVGSAS